MQNNLPYGYDELQITIYLCQNMQNLRCKTLWVNKLIYNPEDCRDLFTFTKLCVF